MDESLSVSEAARKLQVTLDLIYRLLAAGKLPGEKRDGKWRIPASAVQARIEQRSH